MDYGKYRYEQEQKAKLARKHQSQIHVKEIKLRPKIGQHDYETKNGHVVRFLIQRAKVKVTIMFRGREMTHPERGRDLLLLVAVLRVVHDPAHGRTRIGSNLDQVEVLVPRVLQRIVGALDPDLSAVFVDQANLGHANALVDTGGRFLGPLVEWPARPQATRLVTIIPKLTVSSRSTKKNGRTAAPVLRCQLG
jgi:hypothetical protein